MRINSADSDEGTALIIAAYKGHFLIAERLLEARANVNAQENRHEFTPLIEAAWKGHKEVAELLLAYGADTTMKTKDGITALGRAKMNGHQEIVRMLEAKGAP